jgi:hypothetical protein
MARTQLQHVLTQPSADALWQLRGDLLAAGTAPDAPLLRVIGRFHYFLVELASGVDAQAFTNMALYLDIGAGVGEMVQKQAEKPLEELLDLRYGTVPEWLTQGLQVLAAREHTKAAAAHLEALAHTTAYDLYGLYWAFSAESQPTLSPTQRRAHLDDLFAPVQAAQTATVQAVLIGRLFQLLLLMHTAAASAVG